MDSMFSSKAAVKLEVGLKVNLNVLVGKKVMVKICTLCHLMVSNLLDI